MQDARPPDERDVDGVDDGVRPHARPVTVFVSGEQCSLRNSALAAVEKSCSTVLLIESIGRSAERPFHKRKLVLIFSVMREFAAALRAEGWAVDYRSEEPSYEAAFAAHCAEYRPTVVRSMQQSEWGLSERLRAFTAAGGATYEEHAHCNFISEPADFDRYLKADDARITMETFYRGMRRKTGLLMEPDGTPVGGAWNYDAENRLPPKVGMHFAPEPAVPIRDSTRAAIEMVERLFPDHPGTIGTWDVPVTRADALAHAEEFFRYRLDAFGPYEDAMLTGRRVMAHSRLSALINVGLLHPLELCERAELAYRTGKARLSSVEGFIRQLIGRREFVWRTYWRFMPEYKTRNALGADLPVPPWFDSVRTEMLCMRQTLESVRDLGWTHHIPRLMILGNFGLIAGIEPRALNDWFWTRFVDGYDWVMAPNVIGMTLHADGGFVGTKPYAASANYIDKMSDYCKPCRYDPKKLDGESACPYNALYWDFLDRNEARFARNPRMSLVMRSWAAKDLTWKTRVRTRARALRKKLRAGESL